MLIFQGSMRTSWRKKIRVGKILTYEVYDYNGVLAIGGGRGLI
jgi:hypothetical protein